MGICQNNLLSSVLYEKDRLYNAGLVRIITAVRLFFIAWSARSVHFLSNWCWRQSRISKLVLGWVAGHLLFHFYKDGIILVWWLHLAKDIRNYEQEPPRHRELFSDFDESNSLRSGKSFSSYNLCHRYKSVARSLYCPYFHFYFNFHIFLSPSFFFPFVSQSKPSKSTLRRILSFCI